MPKVSIIVPNYNYSKYLPQRLQSIFEQTFADFEVILLDDCSTDDSRQYLQQFASHPKVSHLILGETNTGNPFVQWEKGIALAQGEYIWIAESDDYCEKTFLQNAVRILDENPRLSFTHCGSILVDQNGKVLEQNYDTWPLGKDDGKTYTYASHQYLKDFMFYHNETYNASMTVFRKSKYHLIDKDFTTMHYCGDWLFWIKMAEKGDVAILHKRLNRFRRHCQSVTVKIDRKEKQLAERLIIFTYLWENHIFSGFQLALSKGYVYKEIIRTNMEASRKKQTLANMHKYGVTKKCYYLERATKTLCQILHIKQKQ